MNEDTVCTLCGQYGHRASHCPMNEPAHIARAHFPVAYNSAFGPGYQSQIAHLYGKQDQRGQHMVWANRQPAEIVQNGKSAHQHRARADTSKFAPKHPKAGKPVAGNRAPKGRV